MWEWESEVDLDALIEQQKLQIERAKKKLELEKQVAEQMSKHLEVAKKMAEYESKRVDDLETIAKQLADATAANADQEVIDDLNKAWETLKAQITKAAEEGLKKMEEIFWIQAVV